MDAGTGITAAELLDLLFQWIIFIGAIYLIKKTGKKSIWIILGLVILAQTFMGCAGQPAPIILQTQAPAAQPTPMVVAAAPRKPEIPPDPLASLRPDVRDVIERGIEPTLHDGITTIYPYSPDVQYPIRAMPRHAVEIRLAPDETTDEKSVILGDRDRWSLQVSPQTVLIEPKGNFSYVDPVSKQRVPADPEMNTTLTISTNKRRSYSFTAKMVAKNPTQAVEFYYPADVKQQLEARQLALQAAAKEKK